jgi:hypothetical protein
MAPIRPDDEERARRDRTLYDNISYDPTGRSSSARAPAERQEGAWRSFGRRPRVQRLGPDVRSMASWVHGQRVVDLPTRGASLDRPCVAVSLERPQSALAAMGGRGPERCRRLHPRSRQRPRPTVPERPARFPPMRYASGEARASRMGLRSPSRRRPCEPARSQFLHVGRLREGSAICRMLAPG